ncbi:hypothetical protein CQP30_11200 [Yersinia pestis]|uniref:Uncharacterized protein n=1 Tax=Yersinia pseudotuberculosis TaxID=633 RepID=A0ABM7ANP7_YERPU|nr:hypothetical protein A1122_19120 [Yersinia pestis A1122]ANW13518.1 hypothetical protein BAY22_05820 [Yersinia pestis]AXY32594.1 hypothetical protein CEQ20_03660 [Yersinia pseudotuberculosis]ERP75499.1 hypothetical protein L327_06940 [Yersinia pestis S3]ERP76141.1 hypothetical protein L328_06940 [Yersinia pestis 24H]ERP76781.1 hypothetical protein L326_06920 [Yersinia pestis 113]ERP83444.1 hypothetical protein L325_06900 [Yersinia pestis 9]KFB61690.1 hypothetical protein EX92_00625 [Yersin
MYFRIQIANLPQAFDAISNSDSASETLLMDLWELLIEDFRRFVFDAISKDNAWGGTALLSHTPYT